MTLSSARETLKSCSVPSAELPAFEFSLPSQYAHCPQPPPLIDLGPVPVSNCFLHIEFVPGCWLLSSNFSPPYCPLPCPPSLIFWVASDVIGLTHQLISGPQEQTFFSYYLGTFFLITLELFSYYLGTLGHIKKKRKVFREVLASSSTPLSLPEHLFVWEGIVDVITVI